jgi:Calcineurin-like phosphoesterase
LTSTAGEREKALSRRRFLKIGGGLATAAVVAGIWASTVPSPVRTVLDRKNPESGPESEIKRTTTLREFFGPVSKPFSIFWMTDTQYLSESNPALFKNMTEWIAENWERHNGKMVIHTGDIVQDGADQTQWANAQDAMSVLAERGIPYAWCAGNHDDLILNEPSSGWGGAQWTTAFNPSVARSAMDSMNYADWVDDHHDGMNTAASFSADGLDFLVIAIEWNADSKGVLKWVEQLLADPTYADHHVIIAPHAYVNPTGSTDDPTWGQELSTFIQKLTSLMDSHSTSVFLTMNGHFPTDTGYHTPGFIDNRHHLMFDRQESTDDSRMPVAPPNSPDTSRIGGATVTILTFHPEHNLIRVSTFDTVTREYRNDGSERFAFQMFPPAQTSVPPPALVAPAPTAFPGPSPHPAA